ncbi:hypothetical protein [Aureispira anguillae]|uniref:Uncharacterized protein n=1 Tax=Aureispira anguillae TaxID=2864201 RepID=A0A915YCA5_9BACT|nr:hypothetical protein [Aureispira anguillae]BDS10408.1 hypothetical protein AsAng_0011160 [Aureispira anguillae]
MTVLKALQQGFKQTWQYKSIILFLYCLTLLLAVFVAYPFKSLLESTVGHSMMIADLVKGFDYTFLNDFKNAYGAGLFPIIDQSIAVLGLYLLLFIFVTGGIISTFLQRPTRYNRSIFWGQSAAFFWRLLRLTIYFLVLHSVILGIFLFVFYTSSNGLLPFSLENEGTIAFNFKFIAPIYLIVGAFFFMWQDYTKVILVEQNKKWIFQALVPAFRFIVQNFRKTYGLYLLNLLLWFVVVFINYKISTTISFQTGSDILLSFLYSQIFVLARLSLKLINISSIVTLNNEVLTKPH